MSDSDSEFIPQDQQGQPDEPAEPAEELVGESSTPTGPVEDGQHKEGDHYIPSPFPGSNWEQLGKPWAGRVPWSFFILGLFKLLPSAAQTAGVQYVYHTTSHHIEPFCTGSVCPT